MYTIESLFQRYLNILGVNSEDLTPDRRLDLERAFYGGCSMMCQTIDELTADIKDDQEEAAGSIISEMYRELGAYWMKQGANVHKN